MAPRKELLYAVVLAAGSLVAQPSSGAPASGDRVVTLNVIARDGQNQPIGDLGMDDLKVTDQGKPQRITSFHYQGGAAGKGAVRGHNVVVLFDLLNDDAAYRGYGQELIDKAMQPLETPESLFLYLLTPNGSLYPVHPVSGPDADAAAASGPWTQQIKPLLDSAVQKVYGFKPIDEKVIALRIESTYHALETLASEIAPLPGRKDLIWITRGVPIEIRLVNQEMFDYRPMLQRVATLVDQAGISVSTVDQSQAVSSQSKDTLEEFTELTGGKAYPAGTVDKAVQEAMEAPRATYVIQYAALAPDGKFHKVRVTTTRKGVHLQAEQGYLDSPTLQRKR
jgi:VWFA-related protein